MKRMHDTTDRPSPGVKAGLIAAAILLASATSAIGGETAAQVRPLVMTSQRADGLQLPPIANLNAVPWLTLERAPKGPQIHTLLSPLPAPLPVASGPPTRLPMWPDGLLAAGRTPRNG